MRPVRDSPTLAAWRRLPVAVRWFVYAALAMLGLAPAWRFYGAWWDAWNGVGAFYDRWLPPMGR